MTGQDTEVLWPMPKFQFTVSIGGLGDGVAEEVSGLDAEARVIEYRSCNSKVFSPIKMPGLVATSSATLKKIVFVNNSTFWDWYSRAKMNTIKRDSVTITLRDTEGQATMVWVLSNAWPTKITGPLAAAEGASLVIETLELAHEGLTIENA
jgi:phage tail-like protein